MISKLPYKLVLLLALGCAHSLHPRDSAGRQPDFPAPVYRQNSAPFESAAWRFFQNEDYVRALRLAYRATQIHPNEPSAALLVGLIYDRGFKRPDLALSVFSSSPNDIRALISWHRAYPICFATHRSAPPSFPSAKMNIRPLKGSPWPSFQSCPGFRTKWTPPLHSA